MNDLTVLSLCDRTKNFLVPWAKAGYHCIAYDIAHKTVTVDELGIESYPVDVTFLPEPPKVKYAFCAAFPPCTHLAISGSRWFKDKGLEALYEALGIVIACKKLCEMTNAPWFIENPISTLSTYWGKPDYTFDPCDYGGYEGGEEDAYTKKTCLWTGGGFIMPEKRPIDPVQGSKMHRMPDSKGRAERRSVTPMGFAQAVFEANSKVI